MKKKKETGMTYAGTGVVYSDMDWFKRMAQKSAKETAGNIRRFGIQELSMSRGESVYVIDMGEYYLGFVEEGLGTKSLVADAMFELTGKSYDDKIAQDTLAMILNDMITLGIMPIATAMHLGLGNSDWVKNKKRSKKLIIGWKKSCNMAGCAWGCGETPTLKDIIIPGTVVLSGSAVGIAKPKNKLIKANIKNGDAIVIFESSGIHANGLTLARKIAGKLPRGYLTPLSDGRTYGESLLDPTVIYVKVIEDCLNAGIDIHYAVNITGHGWRKLMRAQEPFVYVI
ncbi:MAG: AIR synthase related protein [Candidatus Paceibacterota bacterium]|jgi:phosphoribosylformylglycinamidine cyclo-ligase